MGVLQKRILGAIAALIVLANCGGNAGGSASAPPATTPTPGPTAPPSPSPTSSVPIQHVVVVVEENHSYESVVGNSAMPYLNSLANHYALATSYFADTHPSIGNYFMLTTGAIITNDDAYSGTVTGDNLARVLNAAGKSWKVYAESIPSAGYLGADAYPYVKRHNPFAFFSDVADPAQASKIVPFSQFGADLSAGTLPNFALVVPNVIDDSHDGPLLVADAWLQSNIDPLFNNAEFQATGLVVIVFDESFDSDTAHGGGHVAAVLAGAKVKASYKSATLFQHESALRLFLDALGVAHRPGAAATAPSMSDFLQ